MKALLLIDIQNAFLPGGSLEVADGDQVIPVANELMDSYEKVIATQDWHPADHLSFASQHPGHEVGEVIKLDELDQILWPDHCVQGTHGALFASALKQDKIQHVVQKGTDRRIDSYSGFFDNAQRKATGLDALLKEIGVTELALVGLATDYCVKFTALDALVLGYKVTIIQDGVRGVNINSGDSDSALSLMSKAGATIG